MNKQSGFSLIELMVVVVILGILASIVVPQLLTRPEQARLIRAKQDILAIQNTLDMYKLDNGFYPSTDQGLLALVEKPDSNPKPADWKRYLKSLPKDPWGHDYVYMNPGEHGEIDIFSQGASDDNNSWIGNWNLQ